MHSETAHQISALVVPFTESASVAKEAPAIDFDALSNACIATARRNDAKARYDAVVATAPHLTDTDWSHPDLAPNADAIHRVRCWNPGRRGVLATGPTRRGKTRAMLDLFRRLACDEGRDVRYYYTGDWFAALQAQIHFGRDDAKGWVEAVAARPLVMLDDIGQEAIQFARADWAQAWFFRFLDLRLAAGLPLIATTNLTAREIAGRANDLRGDPLLRRLLELCEVVKFT